MDKIPKKILSVLEGPFLESKWENLDPEGEAIRALRIICLYNDPVAMKTALFKGLDRFWMDYEDRWNALYELEKLRLIHIAWDSYLYRPSKENFIISEMMITQIYVHPRMRFQLDGYEKLRNTVTIPGAIYRHRFIVPQITNVIPPNHKNSEEPDFYAVHTFSEPIFPNIPYHVKCFVRDDGSIFLSMYEYQ